MGGSMCVEAPTAGWGLLHINGLIGT